MNYSLEDFQSMNDYDLGDVLITESAYRLYQKIKSASPRELARLTPLAINLGKWLRHQEQELD